MEEFSEFFRHQLQQFPAGKKPPNNFRLTSLPHSFGSLNCLTQAMEIEFGLLGDSSLYTKRPKKGKNKRYISEEVRWLLPGNAKLEHSCYPGGGVKEFNDYFSKERPAIQIKTLGISYFGNEHTEKPMNQAKHLEMWKTLFRHLRRHVKERVIFFMGGYAAKYGYCQAYDDNMKIIRRWMREIGGFEVRTDFELVENWPLAADNLHFDVACLPALAKYWEKLLVPKIELKEAPCNKRKRCLQEFPEDTLAKKSCRSEDWKQKDAWKDWILPHSKEFSNIFFRNLVGGPWFQKKYCHPETWGNDPDCRAYFFKWWLVQPPTTIAFKRNQTRDGLLKTDISPENWLLGSVKSPTLNGPPPLSGDMC